jgi:hypothetical protein
LDDSLQDAVDQQPQQAGDVLDPLHHLLAGNDDVVTFAKILSRV